MVSGASRGIGKAIALRLLFGGYTVIGLYKSSDDKASKMVESGVDMQKVDVGLESDVKEVLKYITDKYGRIDVLVNNAGIDIFGRIDTYPLGKWDDMIATNLTSVFLLSKASIPLLSHSNNPNIVNISSRLGIEAYAEPEFIVYGVVRQGLISSPLLWPKNLAIRAYASTR
jgi:3-oxoacyl-[acyl-carrier protein] reductase